MPYYEVIVTRDATESVAVKVQAPNKQEADDVALEYAIEQMDNLNYRLDEGNFHQPYIGNPGGAELLDDEGQPVTNQHANCQFAGSGIVPDYFTICQVDPWTVGGSACGVDGSGQIVMLHFREDLDCTVVPICLHHVPYYASFLIADDIGSLLEIAIVAPDIAAALPDLPSPLPIWTKRQPVARDVRVPYANSMADTAAGPGSN